jgi:hypothetical protein
MKNSHDLKNLMSHVTRPVNRTTTEELPAKELAQLSEEEMQQIWGGDFLDRVRTHIRTPIISPTVR